jgi:hypothetical protein
MVARLLAFVVLPVLAAADSLWGAHLSSKGIQPVDWVSAAISSLLAAGAGFVGIRLATAARKRSKDE